MYTMSHLLCVRLYNFLYLYGFIESKYNYIQFTIVYIIISNLNLINHYDNKIDTVIRKVCVLFYILTMCSIEVAKIQLLYELDDYCRVMRRLD